MAPAPNLRIGQLAELAGVNPKTIRYYESIGLLPEPARSSSGYRLYSSGDTDRLRFIRRAKALGLSLEEIREILNVRSSGELPCGCVREVAGRRVAELDRRIAEMVRMRGDLALLAAAASEYSSGMDDCESGICPAIESSIPAVVT